MTNRLTVILFTIIALATPALAAGDDVPAWLRAAAASAPPAYNKEVPAVVLLNDQRITVGEDGRIVTTRNYAVRILIHEGREEAIAREIYQTDSGKVREMQAWLLRPSGEPKHYGKDRMLDVAMANNDVYNEYRVKAIVATDDADAGYVFGYQVTSEDRSVFSQFEWDFQEHIPSLLSRFTLALPAGWRSTSVTFNHQKIEPVVEGSIYTWELHNLSPIEFEPLSPPITNIAARIAVSYFPATGSANGSLKTFADWSEVSRWMSELEDPQVTVNDALTNKARELTANCKTELERIQAIGTYVQNIQYISIQTGIGRGGGYRPHLATEVFAKSYGDCKDKANLMRAMLKTLGINSFPVSIYSGDRDYVRAEWPSPQQFNHCIIAIQIADQTQAATVIQHSKFGRLLIFDPTATDTPVGDLPFYLQGSLALIDSKDGDALVQMPVTPPAMNHLERTAELQLSGDGALSGTIHEQAAGQTAARFRGEFRQLSRPAYNGMIERWLSSGAMSARISKLDPTDNATEGSFALNVDFSAPAYGQLMQNRLMVFKPAIVSRRDALSLTEATRRQPVVLESRAFSETVRIKLPAGFDVDELPDPVKLDAAFGSYKTTYEVKNGELVFTRALEQRAATIPVEQYDSVRKFFERIRAAEQAPVVLARK